MKLEWKNDPVGWATMYVDGKEIPHQAWTWAEKAVKIQNILESITAAANSLLSFTKNTELASYSSGQLCFSLEQFQELTRLLDILETVLRKSGNYKKLSQSDFTEPATDTTANAQVGRK